MLSSWWNLDMFDQNKHFKAAEAHNAARRHLAYESCLNETRAVILSYKTLRPGVMAQCVTQQHMHTC